MTRRTFLQSAAVAAAARPNIVLIMTDDQGYPDIAAHGNPVLRTPEMDRLRGESVRLTNYHVSPTCAPTRSALLTGRYTNATGAWHTIMGRSLLRPGEVTLADALRRAGYRTGIFGKWHLGDNYPCRPNDRGFEEAVVHGGGGVWQTPDFFGNDYDGDTYFHNTRPEKYEGFCTDVFFDQAMNFMRGSKSASKPFFCYLTPNAPHGPMWAPDRYAERYKNVPGLGEPGFYGMIENIDDNLGRLRRFLASSGLAENTILIFTTDNGTASGARVFGAGMRGNKGAAYDGGHRVPFFFHWPAGGHAKGRDIATLTAHIDVTPTLLDLTGAKRPQGPPVHGRSLRPLLEGKTEAWPERAITVDSQRLENLVKWRQAAVMTGRWRLVNPSPDGDPARLELYDIPADPAQKQNVAAQHPDVVRSLATEYDKWWQDVSQRSDEYVRIVLGHAAENPSRLTAHDWHGEGSEKVWNQAGIRNAPVANGFWAVEIARAGRYRFELRRWPRELDLALNAPYTDPGPNREKAPGKAIEVASARVRVGGVEQSIEVPQGAKAAVFELNLKAGPSELHTWLKSKDGAERGAYYVYVERT